LTATELPPAVGHRGSIVGYCKVLIVVTAQELSNTVLVADDVGPTADTPANRVLSTMRS